jgi:hypothetical protein
MEVLIGLAILLALNEWRDYKFNSRYKKLELKISALTRKLHYVGDLAKKIDDNNLAIQKVSQDFDAANAFIGQAQTDLSTIVKEYQINGVPLGYERGQKYDMVEGL